MKVTLKEFPYLGRWTLDREYEVQSEDDGGVRLIDDEGALLWVSRARLKPVIYSSGWESP